MCTTKTKIVFNENYRTTAKQHYILTHLQKGEKKNANWYESRPSWLSSKGGKRRKGVVTLRPVIKKKLPEDFLIYSPISQEEQYQIVQDRKRTTNYLDSLFKCQFCYRGFREMATYEKHMKKHNPVRIYLSINIVYSTSTVILVTALFNILL